jgi:hypothetical protein
MVAWNPVGARSFRGGDSIYRAKRDAKATPNAHFTKTREIGFNLNTTNRAFSDAYTAAIAFFLV